MTRPEEAARAPSSRTRTDRDKGAGKAAPGGRVRLVRTGFTDLVLVCAKCVKRQELKKGSVKRMLKRELKAGRSGRKARIVEVGCLGPCPKRALVLATTDSLAKQRLHLLDPLGSPADAVATLFPDFGPQGLVERQGRSGTEPASP